MFSMFDPPRETGASHDRYQLSYGLQPSGDSNYEPNLAGSEIFHRTNLDPSASGRHGHVAQPFETQNGQSSLGDAALSDRQAALQDPPVAQTYMHAISYPHHYPPSDGDLQRVGNQQYSIPLPSDEYLSPKPSSTSTSQGSDQEASSKKSEQSGEGTSSRKKSARRARNGYKPALGDEESDSEGDKKRVKFLERNRAAASKSRRKRKDMEDILEARARELSESNSRLSASLLLLRGEVLELKSECLKHTNCNCQAIRNYMTRDVANLNPPQFQSYTGRFCWACGQKLGYDSLYCTVCGASSPVLTSNDNALTSDPGEDSGQWRGDGQSGYWRERENEEGQPG